MGVLTFGHPAHKIASKLILVSPFPSFECPPDPTQLCKLVGIGQVGSAGGGVRVGNESHLHSLYLGREDFQYEWRDELRFIMSRLGASMVLFPCE